MVKERKNNSRYREERQPERGVERAYLRPNETPRRAAGQKEYLGAAAALLPREHPQSVKEREQAEHRHADPEEHGIEVVISEEVSIAIRNHRGKHDKQDGPIDRPGQPPQCRRRPAPLLPCEWVG